MSCKETNNASGCGCGEPMKLLDLDGLKYLLQKLTDKICLAVGSIKVRSTLPLHLEKSFDDEGIVIEGYVDEATAESSGVMSAEDKAALDGLVVTVENHEERITALESSVANIESSVNGLESSVANIESSVNGLESSVNGLESSVANMESSVNGLESSVTNLETSDTNQWSRIVSLEQRVTALESLMSAEDKSHLDELWEHYQAGDFDCHCGDKTYTYSAIAAEVTYDTVPYAGGTVSPTITYKQSWACSDGTSGVITEGATVKCTGLSMPAKYDGTTSGYSASVDSDGAVTISGHSTLGNAWLCCTRFSISLNGVSTSVYGYVYQEQESGVSVTSVTCTVESPKYDNISWEGEDTVSVYWDDYAYTIITNYSDGTKTESHSGAELIVMRYDDWSPDLGGTWSANYSSFNEEPIESGKITIHITSNPTEMDRDIVYPVCRVVYSDANGEWQTADSAAGVIVQSGRPVDWSTPDPAEEQSKAEEALVFNTSGSNYMLATGASSGEPSTGTANAILSDEYILPAGCSLTLSSKEGTFGLRCQEGSDSGFAEPLSASTANVVVGVYIDKSGSTVVQPTYSLGGGSITGSGVAGETVDATCSLMNSVTVAASDSDRVIQLGVAVSSMTLRYMCNIYITTAITLSAVVTVE